MSTHERSSIYLQVHVLLIIMVKNVIQFKNLKYFGFILFSKNIPQRPTKVTMDALQWGSLIFSHIRRLGPFLGVQNLEF